MHRSQRQLTAAASLSALLVLGACDNAEEQVSAPTPPPAAPAGFYAIPEPPAPPPPPNDARLVGPPQIGMPGFVYGSRPETSVQATLTNSGGRPLTIYSATVSGALNVDVKSECPPQLQGGQTCRLTVSWKPTAPGQLSANIVVSASSNSLTIPVFSEAIQETPPAKPMPDPSQLRAMLAAQRLQARRDQGPGIGATDAAQVVVPKRDEFNMKDKDYTREQAPQTTTSYPVDRRYILTMERNLTGTLLREINSQLPGIIQVISAQDVYGTDGRSRLVERGDIFIARYKPLAKQGDTRLNACVFRIIRLADGAHVYDAGDDCFAILTDAMGRTGLVGDVDNRLWDRYGMAFLTAALSAMASAGVNMSSTSNTNPAVQNSGNALSQNLGQATARFLEQSINLAPIMTVAAGERVNIQMLRDIYVRRPELKDATSSVPANKGDKPKS